MNMIPVCSSNIMSIGYEANELFIQFNDSSLYVYHGVPEIVHINLMQAPSHGKFFASFIKGRYSYTKLG